MISSEFTISKDQPHGEWRVLRRVSVSLSRPVQLSDEVAGRWPVKIFREIAERSSTKGGHDQLGKGSLVLKRRAELTTELQRERADGEVTCGEN